MARPKLFECMECGRGFATVRAAERAVSVGCPKCGGSDIDTPTEPKRPPSTVAWWEETYPDEKYLIMLARRGFVRQSSGNSLK